MSFPYIPLYSYAITPKYHIILWVIYPIYRYMYICIQCLPLESSTDIQISYIDYKYIHIHIHTCIYIYMSRLHFIPQLKEHSLADLQASMSLIHIYTYIYSINIIYPIKKKKQYNPIHIYIYIPYIPNTYIPNTYILICIYIYTYHISYISHIYNICIYICIPYVCPIYLH